jgi:uncharacterized protein DUF6982
LEEATYGFAATRYNRVKIVSEKAAVGSTNKRVLIERFDRETLPGFVNPQNFQQSQGVEILTTTGMALVLPYADVKAVHFVRDLEQPALAPDKRIFASRPKLNGLWVRMQFRDGDVLEGLMPNNLTQIEAHGFSVSPPDSFANSQRVFIPREAVESFQVLGVIGSPLRPRKPQRPSSEQQLQIFE